MFFVGLLKVYLCLGFDIDFVNCKYSFLREVRDWLGLLNYKYRFVKLKVLFEYNFFEIGFYLEFGFYEL